MAAVGGVAWYLGAGARPASDERRSDTVGGKAGASSLAEAIAATADAGTATVAIELEARMPPSLDDGIPVRPIEGSGSMAADRSVASLTYELSDVPNSAGFLGHVDGELEVVYSDNQMLISFPILRDILPEATPWMSYELSFLSLKSTMKHGIGQLRELALSDPRLGIALLQGAEDPAGPAGDADAEGAVTEYKLAVAPGDAADAVPEFAPRLAEMEQGLKIDNIPMTVLLDDQRRIRELEYELVYPAKKGRGKVRLTVTTVLSAFGGDVEPEAPGEDEVVSYEEYLRGFFPDDAP